MRRRMARTKKKVDPFEFPGSDDESDDDDKLSAKRKRRNSGNSTPHSLRGSHAGVCSDVDGDRSNCRARLSFSGSDEGEQGDTAASGPGSAEQSDEGDDKQSGPGSTDDDGKVLCSMCAGEISEDIGTITGCGHHVCEFCHEEALEHLDHVKKGNADLKAAMMQFCGLTHRVCLHEWPPAKVFPKRRFDFHGVALLSKNLPKVSLDLNEEGVGLLQRPFFDLDGLVALIDFPPSISFADAKRIGLKVPKNHHGEIKLHPLKTEHTMIGFPGYPDNRQHPKSLETVAPGSSAVSSTLTLWRAEGLGSFFDTKLGTYLPLPLANASGSRIAGEPAFCADGSNSIACSKCGRYWNRKALVSARCGKDSQQLFERALVCLESTHTHTHTHTHRTRARTHA